MTSCKVWCKSLSFYENDCFLFMKIGFWNIFWRILSKSVFHDRISWFRCFLWRFMKFDVISCVQTLIMMVFCSWNCWFVDFLENVDKYFQNLYCMIEYHDFVAVLLHFIKFGLICYSYIDNDGFLLSKLLICEFWEFLTNIFVKFSLIYFVVILSSTGVFWSSFREQDSLLDEDLISIVSSVFR